MHSTAAWKALEAHVDVIKGLHLRDLLEVRHWPAKSARFRASRALFHAAMRAAGTHHLAARAPAAPAAG